MGFGDFLSSVTGGLLGKAADYDVSRKLQHDSQDWSEEMYKHRHQWEVEDLKAAGLNPILSAHGGNASFPSAGISSTGSMGNPVSSAMDVKRVNQEVKESRQRIALSKDQQELLRAQTDAAISSAQREKIETQERQVKHEQLYGDNRGSVTAETSDYPSSIRGPVRSASTAVARVLDSAKALFGRLKSKSSSAVEHRFHDIDEKKLIERIYAPYRRKNISERELINRIYAPYRKERNKKRGYKPIF